MTICAIFFLALILLSEVQSQQPTTSPGLTIPSATTTTYLTPSIEPAFGGGAIPSTLPVPSTLRVSAPSGPTIAPFAFPPLLQKFPSPPAGNSVCPVCGKGYQVVNKKDKFEFIGTMYTCEQMEAAGLRRLIPSVLCVQVLIEVVSQVCGCQPKPISPTKAPTRVRSKSPVK
jgi:hypothetical protein